MKDMFANFHLHVHLPGITTFLRIFMVFQLVVCRLVEFHKLIGHFVEFLFFNYDFTKKQHDQFDCQQLNTTTNHTHPKSFTPDLVT